MTKATILLTLIAGVSLAGCASAPSLPSSRISTGALPATDAKAAAKPAKPVTSAKATNMYVWAGFMEKDCSPVPPNVTVAQAPAKGEVTFRPNETMLVQHSVSGKCVGKSMPGTGIYYKAKKGQFGDDRFTVTAATPGGQVVTRTFNVSIVE